MKLYCLSGNPNKPCFVLKFNNTNLMLDCSLDVTPLLNYLPKPVVQSGKFVNLPGWNLKECSLPIRLDNELKEIEGNVFVDGEPEFSIPEFRMLDMSEVDAILISNYHCMLALPFLTEYTQFKGIIYATEPTICIGKQYMLELVEYLERSPKHNVADKWKQQNVLSFLPPPLRDSLSPSSWKLCYNSHNVESCLSRIHTVGFRQSLNIFGELKVMAISSGFAIGSSNWLIQSSHEKIAYCGSTSTLTTHPQPLEQSPLRNADILILSGLTQVPKHGPDNMIKGFCMNSAKTLRNRGNVLIPCYSSGITYDLFECLSQHLDTCSLSQIPLYFISPMAKNSLEYSNIYAEWLSSGKQSKVFLPEPPFPHAELLKSNRLRYFSNVCDLMNKIKTPCVVFAGHPSLRFGDVVHFVELWGKSPNNTIIFTEPDFPHLEALAPYQPLAMKVSHCPIDTGLNFHQANKLVKELKPSHLVVSERYLVPPSSMPPDSELRIEWDPPPIPYKRGDILKLPIQRTYQQSTLDPELAATLNPTEIKPGVSIASVTSNLITKDNKLVLKLPSVAKPETTLPNIETYQYKKPSYTWGNLDVYEFVENLKKCGFEDVKLEANANNGHIVHMANDDVLIQIEESSTHIICEGDEPQRIKLKNSLLKCLSSF